MSPRGELVRTYHERIPYVHMKDIDAAGGFVPLGEGVLDVAGWSRCCARRTSTAG